MSEEIEGRMEREKKLVADRKAIQAYLRSRIEELDRSLAKHFAKGNFIWAAHDAKKMAELLYLLGETEIS
jgi:hypothetical protein